MRSNLPAPSQPWGADIERRLAALENRFGVGGSISNYLESRVASLTTQVARAGAPVFKHYGEPSLGKRLQKIDEPSRGNVFSVYSVSSGWPEHCRECLVFASIGGQFYAADNKREEARKNSIWVYFDTPEGQEGSTVARYYEGAGSGFPVQTSTAFTRSRDMTSTSVNITVKGEVFPDLNLLWPDTNATLRVAVSMIFY